MAIGFWNSLDIYLNEFISFANVDFCDQDSFVFFFFKLKLLLLSFVK